jgi:hypothetical protein
MGDMENVNETCTFSGVSARLEITTSALEVVILNLGVGYD